MNVQKGVFLAPWVMMLKDLENDEPKKAIYCCVSQHNTRSYHLLTKPDLAFTLTQVREACPRLVPYSDQRYFLSEEMAVYYKMRFDEITKQNEGMIDWVRENLHSASHLKAVKENIVKKI